MTSSYRVFVRMIDLPDKMFRQNTALAGTHSERNDPRKDRSQNGNQRNVLGQRKIVHQKVLLGLFHTGGKGSITQWVHVEYMEGSETICPTFTQWVRGGYFLKVPTKVPTG